jgi:type VI secretion system protein ImpL
VLSILSVSPWLVIGVTLLLALLVLVGLVVLVRRAARSPKERTRPPRVRPESAAEPEEGEPPVEVARFGKDGLDVSFARALAFLRQRVALSDHRYGLPWYLVLGESGSGKSAALAGSGLTLPFGRPDEVAELGHPDLSWWLFEQAVVLDPAGRFVYDRTGRAEDVRGWRRLLALLRRHRPKRPLDGVVLALPATDLIGPERLSVDELQRKADRLNRKLVDLQRELGMSVPVYLLITKTDAVPGFEGLWRQVPETRRGEILGWSTPGGERGFSPGWVREALAGIGAGLVRVQLEVAADPAAPAASGEQLDGLCLFPHAFRGLEEPLGVLLARLFRNSGYHASFLLRGLYFSGALEPAPASLGLLPDEAPAAAGPRPILTRDLLSEIVFREAGLAGPARQVLLARNRALRALQIGVAAAMTVALIGVSFAYPRLQGEVAELVPALHQVSSAMAERRQAELAAAGTAGTVASGLQRAFFREADALRLLDVMAGIHASRLYSVFLPTSLVSGLQGRIEGFLTEAFELVVLRAMYLHLDHRAARLLAVPADGGGGAEAGLLVEETGAFAALEDFVLGLREIEDQARRLNALGDTGSVASLAELVESIFGVRLPSSFVEEGHLYQRALRRARYERFDAARLEGRASTRLREHAWTLYERVLAGGGVGSALSELALDLRALVREGGRDPDADAARLERARTSLAALEALLARPEVAWIASERFHLGARFETLLAEIEASHLFEPGLALEIAEMGEGEFERFQARLLAYRAPVFGTVLAERDGRPQPRLSPLVAGFAEASAELLARPFMAVAGEAALPPRYDPTRPGRWDPARLRRALSLFEEYDRFAATRLEDFPGELRGLVDRLAVERLVAAIGRELRAAWVTGGTIEPAGLAPREDTLAARVAGFREAAPSLERLVTVLRQLGAGEARATLDRLATDHALDLLARVDRLVEADAPYDRRGRLDYWDGVRPAALYAYDAHDPTELRLYLDQERERLQYLFQDLGEPLVTFLSRRDLGRLPEARALTVRWQRMFDELGRYASRRPDSSILALERFVQSDMASVTADNCLERIDFEALSGGGSGDFFVERRVALAESMLMRCLELGIDRAALRFNRLAARFDAALAGRFPFADDARRPLAVDPETVHAFMLEHRETIAGLREELLDFHGGDAEWSRALDFLGALERASAFLFPDGPAPGAPAPAYLVGVDFRAMRERERGGSHIIHWELRIGDERRRQGDDPRPLLWRPGDPVTLTLRWAAQSPLRPAEDGRDGAVVAGDTWRLALRDPWALLRLVALLREEVPGEDGEGHLLRLEIPTETTGYEAVALADAPTTTRVFLRLGLYAPAAEGRPGEALAMPALPPRAPRLSEAVPDYGRTPSQAPPRRVLDAQRGDDPRDGFGGDDARRGLGRLPR